MKCLLRVAVICLLLAVVSEVVDSHRHRHRHRHRLHKAKLTKAAGLGNSDTDPESGNVLSCSIDYFNNPVAIPRASVITPSSPRVFPNKRDYAECFSGGRGAREATPVRMSANATTATDYRVTVSVTRTNDAISVMVNNARDEPVSISVNSSSANVRADPELPARREIPRNWKQQLLTVVPINRNLSWPFEWSWSVQPIVYEQVECNQQLYSNGVFLIVEQRRRESTFYAYNERDDIDAPVFLNLDVMAALGTDKGNLVLSDERLVHTIVAPRQKQQLLTIRPKDVSQPWGFRFEYRWQTGSSPAYIFGIRQS